jgi:6-phosphogluconolactonase
MTLLTVVREPGDLVEPAADWLAAELAAAIDARGACAVALSGGRTPEPVYRALAAAEGIAWEKVTVFFADERAVPPHHAESNYRMVRAALLSRVPIPEAGVHRMEAERQDRDAAAREYAQQLPPALDLLVLGIGADGHTASLFPRSPALDERRRLVVPAVGTKTPVERMTITPPVIEAARRVAVIATGGDKAAAVARALEGPLAPRELPGQLARRGAWFLDRAAAAMLTAPRVGA